MNHYKRYWPLKVLFFFVAATAFVSLVGLVVMTLWNKLLPEILGVRSINFWQSIGLLILSRILFGGWGSKFGRHHSSPRKAFWRNKWHAMSDEEKANFKARWKDKCGRNKPSE